MKECKICNEQFQSRSVLNVYCSKQCKQKADIDKRSKKPKTKNCQICKSEFTPYTSLDKFCSANCRVENMKSQRTRRWNKESTEKRFGENNPSFKSGMYTRDNRKSEEGQKQYLRTRNEMREEMMKFAGHLFCERCGTQETYQWEMHHLVYRSEKPNHEFLHDKRNLINLCMKCHNWFHQSKGNRDWWVERRKLWELFGEDIRDKSYKKLK